MNNTVKISKTSYKTSVNMFYNAYTVWIKADFEDGDGYYRKWGTIVIANDEKDAKKIANRILDEYKHLCPVSFKDEQGWKDFIDVMRNDFDSDMEEKIER